MTDDPPRSRAMEVARLSKNDKIARIRELWVQLNMRPQYRAKPLTGLSDDQLTATLLNLEEKL